MFVLLLDIRKKLLKTWIIYSATIVFIVFIQTIFDKFEHIEWLAWIWTCGNILPVFLLLVVVVIRNKKPASLLYPYMARWIHGLFLFHLSLMLITLLTIPLSTRERSLEDHLWLSFGFLIPSGLIVITILLLLFFTKINLVKTTNENLAAYINTKLQYLQKSGYLRASKALEMLNASVAPTEVCRFLRTTSMPIDYIILWEGQLTQWEMDQQSGLFSDQELLRTQRGIMSNMVDGISDLEE